MVRKAKDGDVISDASTIPANLDARLSYLKTRVGGLFSGVVAISWEETYYENPLYKDWKVPYRVYIARESRSFLNNCERLLRVYGNYLTPDDYNAIQDLLTDPFLSILVNFDRDTHKFFRETFDPTSVLVHPFNKKKYKGLIDALESVLSRNEA